MKQSQLSGCLKNNYISQVDPVSRTWSISYLDPDIPSLVASKSPKANEWWEWKTAFLRRICSKRKLFVGSPRIIPDLKNNWWELQPGSERPDLGLCHWRQSMHLWLLRKRWYIVDDDMSRLNSSRRNSFDIVIFMYSYILMMMMMRMRMRMRMRVGKCVITCLHVFQHYLRLAYSLRVVRNPSEKRNSTELRAA